MKSFSALGSKPNFVRSKVRLPLSRIRSTIFSPKITGSVDTRKSTTLFLRLELDATVLRDPALGDVEVREDLDARRERRLHLHRRLHDLLQRAVDPVAHPDFLLVRLDVDIGHALLDGVREQAVDELHDRRGIDLGGERRVVLVVLSSMTSTSSKIVPLVEASVHLGRRPPPRSSSPDACGGCTRRRSPARSRASR